MASIVGLRSGRSYLQINVFREIRDEIGVGLLAIGGVKAHIAVHVARPDFEGSVLEMEAPLLVDLGGAVRFRKHLHANLGGDGAGVGIRRDA